MINSGKRVRVGVVVSAAVILVAMALIATPLAIDAPFLAMHASGLESPWVAGGAYVAVLALAGTCMRGIVRRALRKWPEDERSLRLGLVAVPVVTLGCLFLPQAVNEHAAAIAAVSLPAVFAVAMGAATAWIAGSR